MPSERFYRLSEEKRKMICEAAIKEFARVTIDKVSINQIIKNANISRGSFIHILRTNGMCWPIFLRTAARNLWL